MKTGPTLEDVCRMCANRAVRLNIGVHPRHVGILPHRITIQVESPLPNVKPEAFSMDLISGNSTMNRQLGIALGNFVDKVAPMRMKIITEL